MFENSLPNLPIKNPSTYQILNSMYQKSILAKNTKVSQKISKYPNEYLRVQERIQVSNLIPKCHIFHEMFHFQTLLKISTYF